MYQSLDDPFQQKDLRNMQRKAVSMRMSFTTDSIPATRLHALTFQWSSATQH